MPDLSFLPLFVTLLSHFRTCGPIGLRQKVGAEALSTSFLTAILAILFSTCLLSWRYFKLSQWRDVPECTKLNRKHCEWCLWIFWWKSLIFSFMTPAQPCNIEKCHTSQSCEGLCAWPSRDIRPILFQQFFSKPSHYLIKAF